MITTNELRKPTRTISGVAPLAVMLPPRPCEHGSCLFCPNLGAPQSYTPKSPVVMRASAVGFDAFAQVRDRLETLKKMGHLTDKIELIIMGGTFLSYPLEYQDKFVKGCYDALNGKKSKTLEEAKRANEKAEHRCVALCIETRPDVCSQNEIKRMLGFGATRVELGVQAIDDKIYKLNKRGHTVRDVVEATERLKKAGFKVGYHIMPGIYGSNLRKDLQMFKKLFSDERFKPDQIKIYPCQVLKGSELEELYKKGKYKPYSAEETRKLLIEMFKVIPEYCRVMRVLREIPPSYLVSGISELGLRKEVEDEIRKKRMEIKEIRFREVGFALGKGKEINKEIKIKKVEYSASDGKEIFLEAVNKDGILFGLLRLRLEKDKKREAMIREIHVYGRATEIGGKGEVQHRGLGKELIKTAEEIARKDKRKAVRIISGVGVREYYRSLGYMLDKEGYMIKSEQSI